MTRPREKSEALLEAYRRDQGLSPEHRERLLADLNQRIAQGAVPIAGIEASVPRLPGTLQRFWALAPKVWVSTLLLVPAVYVAVVSLPGEDPSTSEADVQQPAAAPLPPATRPSTKASPFLEPVVEQWVQEQPADPSAPQRADAKGAKRPSRRRAARRRRRPEPEKASPASSIEQELSMLRRANVQLQADNPSSALGTLRALDREVPEGSLRDARTLTRVLALCASGDEARARSTARAFLGAHAHSPYAARIRTACPAP